MKKEQLTTFQSVERWFANLPKIRTRNNYLLALYEFVEFSKMNPKEIVDLGRRDPEEVHDLMKMYYQNMNLASKTRISRYYALRSFCKANRIRLGEKPRTFRAVVEYEPRRIYTQMEVVELVDAAKGFRNKALIAFLAQSGQRIGIITNLKIGQINIDGKPPLTVEVPPVLRDKYGRNVNKSEKPYEFAICTDTVQYLRLMIRERQERGELINNESPLFRSYSIKSDSSGSKKIGYAKSGWPLTTSAAGKIVRDAAEQAGIQQKNIKRYLFHPHGFRRYWKHQTRKGGMGQDLLEYMLGHTLPYDGAYDQWTHEDIKREYSRSEKYLRIRPRFEKDEDTLAEEVELFRILFRSDRSKLEGIANSLGISSVQIMELLKMMKKEAL